MDQFPKETAGQTGAALAQRCLCQVSGQPLTPGTLQKWAVVPVLNRQASWGVAVEHGDIEAQGEKKPAGWMGVGSQRGERVYRWALGWNTVDISSLFTYFLPRVISLLIISLISHFYSSHLVPPSWFSAPTPVSLSLVNSWYILFAFVFLS